MPHEITMEKKISNLLLWHKITLLQAVSIVLLTVGIAVATLYSLNQAGRHIELDSKKVLSDQTELFLEKLVRERVDNLDANLRNVRVIASYGAITLQNNQNQHQSFLKGLLATICSQTQHCAKAYFISSQGEMSVYPPLIRKPESLHQLNLTKESYFPRSEEFSDHKGRTVWSKVYADPLANHYELVIDAVAPIIVKNTIQGYIGVSVSLTKMITQLNQYAPIRGSYSFLLDSNFQLIAAPPTARVELATARLYRPRGIIDLREADNPELDAALQKMVLGESAIKGLLIKSELKYLAYHPLSSINWRLGLVVPVKMVTAASKGLVEIIDTGKWQVFINIVSWASGFSLLALLAGIMLSRHLTRPIREMSKITENITQGSFIGRTKVFGGDEFGKLGRAFNVMAGKIQSTINDLNMNNAILKKEVGERKQAEEALRKHREQLEELVAERSHELQKSEERLRNVIQSTPMGILMFV